MPSYNIFYSRIRNYFDGNELRLNILKAIYRVMPLITAATYIAVLALLFVRHDARLIRVTCYPCIVFVAASIFRKCYNRPRPYEGNDAIIPLISKDKKGQSFPSRHALSAAVIASACFYVYVPLGIIIAAISVVIAITRVIAGVHYPSDAAGGLIIGYGLCTLLFLYI